MSGAESSTAKLFLRAAELLLGGQPDPTGDHDAEHMLQALGYAAPESGASGEATASETANRAHLLKAASQFARVFELAAPDAPGLISFGAQFDPALADPMHAGGPMVSVSGVGLSLQEAFQGCIGEGIEYLSQLQSGSDALLEAGFDEATAGLGAPALEFIAALEARRTHADPARSWHRATRHADGREVLLPSDVCVRRPPAQREFPPPFPLSTGSAAGPSHAAAALHGLLELIERDAASLWWRGGQFGRSIPPRHEAGVVAENVLQQLRQSATGRRRTWLLDITTDIGVPCVAAVSCRPDGSGFAFGLAARPRLEAAAHSAILEMCQLELADAVVATKRGERGDAALNAQDRTHLRRAMINADQCALLQPVAEPAAHLVIAATEASVIFELIVQRLRQLGIETFCIDLMRQRFAIPVVRVIAPGLQLEPSEIATARLRHTIARTGGGATYTGGVALM
ncbi:MAG: YcaO-like family protein [Xanthobacteraceae bacterium]|nr:YcaO-like family protein [Xanthobacteraceae bacterium]